MSFLAACSPDSESAEARSARARAPSASVAEAGSGLAATDSSAGADCDRPGETYTLDKPFAGALDVEVHWTKSCASTHFADRVRILGASGRELILETAEDAAARGTPLAPLLEVQRRIDSERVLLLGWSSYGMATQTYEALVVSTRVPRIVGRLRWTDGRGGAGVAVSGTRIGVTRPTTFDAEVVVGKARYDREALAGLDYRPPTTDATFYAAPFRHDEQRCRGARFAWFDVSAGIP
jgi:hypothetical protein